MKNYFQYQIDENTFELKSSTNTLVNIDMPFYISVKLPGISEISHKIKSREVEFCIENINENEYWIISKYEHIYIKTGKSKDLQRFMISNISQMVGLISATLISVNNEDFLWIEPSNEQNVWIIGTFWNSDKKYWDCMLEECTKPRQTELDLSFWSYNVNKENKQKQFARALFNSLTDKKCIGLPDDFLYFSECTISSQSKNRRLTIKVNPSELWFLFFPIDYFCQFGYGMLSLYKEVEWIFTPQKSYFQNIHERLLIKNELKNIYKFLKHSIVILNTYPEFDNEPKLKHKWRKGTNLVIKILSLLQDIDIDDKAVSLRWYYNPSKNIVITEILDLSTFYFFGNFHTINRVWQQGEEIKPLDKNGKCLTKTIELVDILKDKSLSHIRLMRIFHCHSIMFPDSLFINPSIVPSLLNAGAWRVEGSIMEESYLDYLCSLLYVFCDPDGLRFILMAKCLEKLLDFNDIMAEVNEFVSLCNWDSKFNYDSNVLIGG